MENVVSTNCAENDSVNEGNKVSNALSSVFFEESILFGSWRIHLMYS